MEKHLIGQVLPYKVSADYPGCYCRKSGDLIEWLNPPMIPGEEYLTASRWNGAPVYTTMIQLEQMQESPSEIITEISADLVVSHAGCIGAYSLPVVDDSEEGTAGAVVNASVKDSVITVTIACGSDHFEKTAMVQVWYTKPLGGSTDGEN